MNALHGGSNLTRFLFFRVTMVCSGGCYALTGKHTLCSFGRFDFCRRCVRSVTFFFLSCCHERIGAEKRLLFIFDFSCWCRTFVVGEFILFSFDAVNELKRETPLVFFFLISLVAVGHSRWAILFLFSSVVVYEFERSTLFFWISFVAVDYSGCPIFLLFLCCHERIGVRNFSCFNFF